MSEAELRIIREIADLRADNQPRPTWLAARCAAEDLQSPTERSPTALSIGLRTGGEGSAYLANFFQGTYGPLRTNLSRAALSMRLKGSGVTARIRSNQSTRSIGRSSPGRAAQ